MQVEYLQVEDEQAKNAEDPTSIQFKTKFICRYEFDK